MDIHPSRAPLLIVGGQFKLSLLEFLRQEPLPKFHSQLCQLDPAALAILRDFWGALDCDFQKFGSDFGDVFPSRV